METSWPARWLIPALDSALEPGRTNTGGSPWPGSHPSLEAQGRSSALERELGGALFHRKPSIALTGLGRMVRPYLDEIARNADHAREVARTLTPRPSVHRSARHAVESLEYPSN